MFGPGSRGNVYVLLKQIASGRGVIFGSGSNRKSLAYVGNIAEFLLHVLRFGLGVHVYNYVGKPDFDVRGVLELVNQTPWDGPAPLGSPTPPAWRPGWRAISRPD